jgi:Flp pilus assembly pilin Flp
MTTKRAGHADERGAGVVEYALIVALVAIASVAGVALFGGSVASSITASSEGLNTDGSSEATTTTTTKAPFNQEKDVETDEGGDVRFEEVDGRVQIDNISSDDGWTAKVTKDNGRRATVRFTNTDTGERVTVTSWLNKKSVLKSRVR